MLLLSYSSPWLVNVPNDFVAAVCGQSATPPMAFVHPSGKLSMTSRVRVPGLPEPQ